MYFKFSLAHTVNDDSKCRHKLQEVLQTVCFAIWVSTVFSRPQNINFVGSTYAYLALIEYTLDKRESVPIRHYRMVTLVSFKNVQNLIQTQVSSFFKFFIANLIRASSQNLQFLSKKIICILNHVVEKHCGYFLTQFTMDHGPLSMVYHRIL